MHGFHYQNGALWADDLPVAHIIEQTNTPAYIYCASVIERQYAQLHTAFGTHPHQICYAVKANSHLAILNLLSKQGAGFDIVSGGELERVLAAGGKPQQIVFSGVGKTTTEIERALAVGIGCFNVESASELRRIQNIAKAMNKKAPIALRVNPNIDAKTHPYISTGLKENKFGVALDEAVSLYEEASHASHLEIKGVGCHIGSQCTELEPMVEALQSLLALRAQLEKKGIAIAHIDVGGGLGIRYQDETPPTPKEYVQALLAHVPADLPLWLEPGRLLVAEAGILVMRVEYLKTTPGHHFAIVDAGMNDYLRPALYSAWQRILPVQERTDATAEIYDVVGPVCETADFLGKNRKLAIQEGDLLALMEAGAYGASMSSNYNSRARPAEIIVRGDQFAIITARESLPQLWQREKLT